MEGEALKAWRLDAGLDQAAGAEKLGVSRSALASYESGRRAVPPNVAAKITGGETFEVENRPEAALRKLPPAEMAKAKAADLKAATGGAGIRAAALAAGCGDRWARALERLKARRVTAKEAAADPVAFDGPNVWTYTGADGVQVVVKFSANGQGWPSLRRLGDAGFVPNARKGGGGNPKAPPPGRRQAA